MSVKISVEHIQKKIDNLNNINKWSERLNEIKNIKEDINKETNVINNILQSLDEPIIISKQYNLDKIINDFSKVDLSKKIKYYQYLNQYAKNIENELFN
jgi:cell division GTPase FtsZ